MDNKGQILTGLIKIFNRWRVLLSSLSEKQITTPLLPSSWTVKDVVAHMWAWQQASVARAEAALNDKEPKYPEWWQINGPDPEKDLDRTNAWIYEANRDKPWQGVYAEWKRQFQRFLELTEHIPEKDLFEHGRYAWMGSYTLSRSPIASLEHHEEHIDTLLSWLREHANMKTSR